MSPKPDNASDPRSHRRTEDDRFLRGAGHYVDDDGAYGQLHAIFVRSPHAHAAVRGIDDTDARALPGVAGIFTAADLHADSVQPLPCAMSFPPEVGLVVPPRHALAAGHARFVGEPVAIVVAATPHQARDAAEALVIDYDPLPSVTDLGRALNPGASLVWPEAPGNLAFHFRRGDPAAVATAFAAAAHTVSLTLVNNRVVAAPLETRTAIASTDGDRLRLFLSGQDVHSIRRDLAACFGLPPAAIHVVCPDVGGGFGMKNVLHPEHVALLWAARRLQRPIRWIADRTEDFLAAVHGRDNETHARLALDEHGRILALDVHTVGNLGAYVSALGPGAHTNSPASAMGGIYAIPAIAMDVRGAFTNTTPVDAYRGAGKPEANYVIERLIDAAAHQMGHDPAMLRRANLISSFPYQSALGIEIDTARFHDNLDAVLAATDADTFADRRAESASRGRRRGRGVACFLETSRGKPMEDAEVRFEPDGKVALLVGTQSNGQGLETSFAHLASNRLGLPPDAFHLVQADTDRVGWGGGHGGARSIPMAGTALALALDAVLAKAHVAAAHLLQTPPDQVAFAHGDFRTEAGAAISLAHLAATLTAGSLDTHAHNPNEQFVFPNGAHVAEVEIDPNTGAVTLCRYFAVDDYGVLLNPLLTEGQVQGGLAQGIGQALLERVHYDADGQLLTASFADYTLPRASDLPSLDVVFNEHPTARNPLGAKGAGQAGAIGAPQTIMAAIADAIGIAHLDMPATPERVWRACRAVL